MTTNLWISARTGAVLLCFFAAVGRASADEVLGVSAAADGTVDAARQCDVYVVAGVATGNRAEPLRYRWVEGSMVLAGWHEVRADGTAPLELCGLSAGTHALTVQVTDGHRTVSDTMVATIVSGPAMIARGDDAAIR